MTISRFFGLVFLLAMLIFSISCSEDGDSGSGTPLYHPDGDYYEPAPTPEDGDDGAEQEDGDVSGDSTDGDDVPDGDAADVETPTDGDEADPCNPNPCTEENRGRCLADAEGQAVCTCDDGYEDYGQGDCLPSDPCADDESCVADHRVCENEAGIAICGDCMAGYYEDGGVCLEEQLCTESTCSDHGSCDDTSGNPVCSCDDPWSGDHCETCTLPENWPPVQPWADGKICMLPECSESEALCFDPSGMWVRTLTTTFSDCGGIIGTVDARVNVGNVDIGPPEDLAMVGGCDYAADGSVAGVVHGNTVITCDTNLQTMNVTSVETAVITFEGDVGTGGAYVFLYDVPAIAGTDCYIEFNVLYQRQ